MMKHILFGTILVSFAVSAQATLIVDNFNRANTALVSSNDVPGTIGGDWIMGQGQANAQVRIESNQLRLGATGSNPYTVLLNTGTETLSGAGNSFGLSVTSDPNNNANNMPGLAWNYQSLGNYYYFRYWQGNKVAHIFRVVDGVLSPTIGSISTPDFADYVAGAKYRLSVASSTLYEFDITVEELSSGKTASTTVVDPLEQFTGGYGGIASGAGQIFYDDFELGVIPEPTTLSLMGIMLLAALFKRRTLLR